MFAGVVFIKVNFLFEISFIYDVQCKNAYIFNIYAPSTWMDSFSFFLFRLLSFTISKNIFCMHRIIQQMKMPYLRYCAESNFMNRRHIEKFPKKKCWVLLMKLGSGIDLFSFLIRFFRYFVFFAKIHENDRLISSYIDDEWITTLQEPNRFSAIIGSTLKDFQIKAHAVVKCRFYKYRNGAKKKIKSWQAFTFEYE